MMIDTVNTNNTLIDRSTCVRGRILIVQNETF